MVNRLRTGVTTLLAGAALLRRLRVDRRFSVALMVAVSLSAVSLAAIPRLLNRMSDAGFRQALQEAQRNQPAISVTLRQRLPDGDAPLGAVEAKGIRYQGGMAAPLRPAISDHQAVAESPRFIVRGLSPDAKSACAPQFRVPNPCLLNVRAVPGDGLRVTAGRLPRLHASLPASEVPALKAAQPLPLVEIALSAKTAAALRLSIGDRIVIQPDPSDSLAANIPIELLNYRIVVELVGLIAPVQPSALLWRGDDTLLEPAIQQNPDYEIVSATALMAPEAYPQLLGLTAPIDWRYTWRYAVDPARLAASSVGMLSAALHALQLSRGPASTLDADSTRISLRTNLPATIDRYQRQRALAVGSLSIATISIFGVALALVGVLAALFAQRRWAQLALLRSRGATPAQLGMAQFGEGLILAVPSALAGYGGAVLLVSARASTISLVATLGLAVATPLALLIGSLPTIRRPLGAVLGQRAETSATLRARRLVVEGLLVLLAVLGLVLLQRRGLTPRLSAASADFDPYLSFVPILAGLATGILTLRLAPLPIRALGRLARRRRDLVPFVALRWVAGQPAVAWLPGLVLLLAVGATTLMAVLHDSLDTAQHAQAWQKVGADFRVDASPGQMLPATFDLATRSGVTRVAQAVLLPEVSLSGQTSMSQVPLIAVDSDAYAAVTAGTPAAPHFPASMLGHRSKNGLGSQANPIPVIASSVWPGTAPLRGDLLQTSLGSSPVAFQVVTVRPSFPSMPAGQPFIVAPLRQLRAAGLAGALQPNRSLLRGTARAQESLETALAAVAPSAQLTSRAAVGAVIQQEPFLGGVTRLYQLSAGLVILFALAAVLSGLMLTTAERMRDLTYLRTLGLSTRQLLGLTAIEQALPVLLASLIGAGLGLALAHGVAPAIDLGAVAGSDRPVVLLVDWLQLAGVVAGLAALTLVLVVLVSLLLRRVNPAMVLRGGSA